HMRKIDGLAAKRLSRLGCACLSVLVTFWGAVAPAALAVSENGRPWQDLQKDGTEAFDQARYGDAERILNQAVIRGAAFGENDLRFAASLGLLGRLLSVRGRFSEAEPLLEEELHAKEQALGEGSIDLIPSMRSMIEFYLAHGTAKKADPLTWEVLAI